MPVNNSNYTRGRQSKVKGQAERAAKDKQRFSQSRFTIRFRNGGIEVELLKKGRLQ